MSEKMFWERFVSECGRIGKKPNTVAKELHISSGTVTAWKYGGTPSTMTLKRLCEYFGVRIEYLTGYSEFRGSTDSVDKSKELGNPLTGVEFALYGELQGLTEEQLLDILDYIRFKKQQWETRQ